MRLTTFFLNNSVFSRDAVILQIIYLLRYYLIFIWFYTFIDAILNYNVKEIINSKCLSYLFKHIFLKHILNYLNLLFFSIHNLIASLVNVLTGSSCLFKILWTADCPNPICDLAKSQTSSAAVFWVIPSKAFLCCWNTFINSSTMIWSSHVCNEICRGHNIISRADHNQHRNH